MAKKLTQFYYAEKIWYKKILAEIPCYIITIGKKAFKGDTTVQILKLSEKLETVGQNAFENCTNLERVEFCADLEGKNLKGKTWAEIDEPDTTTDKQATQQTLTIQYQAFRDCGKLHTVIFPQKLQSLVIEREAFTGCTALRTVVIQNARTDVEIDNDAFCGLANVVFVTENEAIRRFAREHEFRAV